MGPVSSTDLLFCVGDADWLQRDVGVMRETGALDPEMNELKDSI